MIRHIVMFKIEGFENEADKLVSCTKIKVALEALPSKIPEIRFFQVGLNVNPLPNAFDIVLVSDFESLDTLNIYKKHPAHVEVVNFINTFDKKSQVVDFEL